MKELQRLCEQLGEDLVGAVLQEAAVPDVNALSFLEEIAAAKAAESAITCSRPAKETYRAVLSLGPARKMVKEKDKGAGVGILERTAPQTTIFQPTRSIVSGRLEVPPWSPSSHSCAFIPEPPVAATANREGGEESRFPGQNADLIPSQLWFEIGTARCNGASQTRALSGLWNRNAFSAHSNSVLAENSDAMLHGTTGAAARANKLRDMHDCFALASRCARTAAAIGGPTAAQRKYLEAMHGFVEHARAIENELVELTLLEPLDEDLDLHGMTMRAVEMILERRIRAAHQWILDHGGESLQFRVIVGRGCHNRTRKARLAQVVNERMAMLGICGRREAHGGAFYVSLPCCEAHFPSRSFSRARTCTKR